MIYSNAIFLAYRIAVLSRQGGRLLAVYEMQQQLQRDESFRYTAEFSTSRLYLWNLLKDDNNEELLPAKHYSQ
jgi:hypothetical protein